MENDHRDSFGRKTIYPCRDQLSKGVFVDEKDAIWWLKYVTPASMLGLS